MQTIVRSFWAFALIYVYTFFYSTLYLLLSPLDRRGSIMNWVLASWSSLCIAASGVRIEASGLENVRPDTSYIIISNHQGFFDIWSVLVLLPLPIRMVFKKELMRIPIFGWAVKSGGHICVDRSDRSTAVEQLEKGWKTIRRHGASLLFFAEGTRSVDGRIGPFKKGGFIMAIQAGLPILPVAIRGSFEILQKKSFIIRPGTVRLRVLPEVAVDGLTLGDKDRLTDQVRERIVAAFEKLGEA